MDNLFMFDAFKALDSLNEDTFKVDDEGIEELSEFEKMNEIDDSVEIIDMHADDEEELEDSYIGKVVLACNVCDSKIFEDKENVVISEENPDSANVDMECPYCHTLDGFKVIGQIGEYCADCDDKHEHDEESVEDEDEHIKDEEIKVEKEESEELEEGKHKEFTSEDDIDADMDDEKEEARKRWERKKNDARSKRDYRMKHDLEEKLEEDDTPKKRTRKKKPLFDSLFDEIYVQLAKTPYSPASYFHRGVYSDISATTDGRDIQLGAPSRTDEYVNGYDTIRIQYNANEESHIPFDFAKKLADKYGLKYRTSPDGVYLYIDIPENAPALNKPVVYRGEFIDSKNLEEDFRDRYYVSFRGPRLGRSYGYYINTPELWEEYFDGTGASVDRICKLLEIPRERLDEAYIPYSVTSIGEYAFYNCDSLESITIPLSVVKIGASAFDECENLKDVYYQGTEKQWDGIDIGYTNEGLDSATIHYNSPIRENKEHSCGKNLEEDFKDDKEVIVPVSAEIKAEIKFDSKEEEVKDENSEEEISEKDVEAEEESSKDESSVEYDFEEMDEGSFDELAESYLKTIYSNVESYKTTNAEATKDKFMIEGLITFASGAIKNTNFVFTPKAATKSGKLQFIGENLQITKNRNAFKFNASISDKKLLGESLTYNYSTKDGAGKMRKLYGTIKRK